jgi:hypothetical protein
VRVWAAVGFPNKDKEGLSASLPPVFHMYLNALVILALL